jgi:phosphoribosylanthranilate isomerase
VPVYKSFRVGEDFEPGMLSRFKTSAYLLDAFAGSHHGGTGKSFDWRLAREAKKHGRIILAGGITPDNVADAVRIVDPYAVDVNSGVESSPGKKDHLKINQLFIALDELQRARRADAVRDPHEFLEF